MRGEGERERERELPRSIGVGDIIGGVWSNILIVVVV
jgi:hypothetical protein